MSPRHICRQRPARADARLLELVASFRRLQRKLDAVHRREDECTGWDEQYIVLQAEVNVLVKQCWRIREAVCATEAHTSAGLAAKASVALWEFSDPTDHPGVAISRSLAVDVMRRAGA